MLKSIYNFITNNEELKGHNQRFLSLVFLFISGVMCFGEYVQINNYWFDSSVTFSPGFISTIFAIFLISPLYLRNILKWNKSIYSIVSAILILLVFASFIELAKGGDGWDNTIIKFGLLGTVLLSWLGMRAVSGIGWILVIVIAIYSLLLNEVAMGFFGFIYICFGFLGLVLHSELNPGALYKELSTEFKGVTSPVMETAKENIKATGEMINRPEFIKENETHVASS